VPHRNKADIPGPTSCYSKEVLSRGAVDLDVSLSYVMLVLPQGKVAMLLALEPDESFAVAPTLLTQAQSHAAPEITRKTTGEMMPTHKSQYITSELNIIFTALTGFTISGNCRLNSAASFRILRFHAVRHWTFTIITHILSASCDFICII
jgi:hypothetical protein